MRTRMWAGVSLAVVLIAGAAAGGYRLYQRHLSDGVKRLLLAANDEHASMMEIRQYTAQARPLVRTKRDREVLGQLEDGLALYAGVQEDEQKDTDEFNETMRGVSNPENEEDPCHGRFYKLIHISESYKRMGVKPPKDLEDHIQDAYRDGKECEERDKQETDARREREKRSRALAVQDLSDVRQAIGLPPLPKS
jgi:hypothetical protein